MLDKFTDAWNDIWNKNSKHQIYAPIPVEKVDRSEDYVKLQEGLHYVKLYLVEMFLKKRVKYLQSWFPAVHALVSFDFQGSTIDVPNIADASKIDANQVGSGDIIARNFELTPLIPYNSGTIKLKAGLLAMQGDNANPAVWEWKTGSANRSFWPGDRS